MKIRRAESSDAEGIARLHVASWQATYRVKNPTDAFIRGCVLEKRCR